MSLGRSIRERRSGWGALQWFRLVGGVMFLLGASAITRFGGVPTELNGRAAVILLLLLLGLGSLTAFAVRHWPDRFGVLSRLAQRMDPNRRLRFTRDGRILVGITLAVGFAATNTGNNFLYLVLGLLAAVILVSGVLSEWVLKDVRVSLEPGGERFAAHPGLVAFHVFNLKKRFNSMSLEVAPILAAPGAAPGADHHRLPGRLFLRLGPQARERGVVRTELPQRGVWTLLGFEVATAYPFGFFRKSKNEVPEPTEAQEVLVLPSPAPVAQELARLRILLGDRPGERAGNGDEFFSLRQHRPTEDVRRVAWKRSARSGRLMVREDEEPRGRLVTLVVPGHLTAPTPAQRQAYEQAHSVAAGLILALLERGDEVGVVAGACAVAPGRGSDARIRLMEALCRARLEDPLTDLPESSRRGSVVVLEGPGEVPGRFSGVVHLAGAAPAPGRSAA